MAMMTIDDVWRLLRAAGGEPDGQVLVSEATDVPLDELGYDSLALLELAARIEREFGVAIPDDAVTELKTARGVLSYVNERVGS